MTTKLSWRAILTIPAALLLGLSAEFTAAAPALAESIPVAFVVDGPADGAVADSRGPVYTGTAPAGTEVTATIDGRRAGRASTGEGTTFTLRLFTIPGPQATLTVKFEATTAGIAQSETRTITVPASLDAPVVTAPVAGASVGEAVTFSGTATPGWYVHVWVNVISDGEVDYEGFVRNSEPALADATGSWSSTLTLAPGRYDADFYLTSDAANWPAASYFAEVDWFTVVAGAAAPPVPIEDAADSEPDVASPAGEPQLAATGSVSGGLVVPGALVLLLGLGLVGVAYTSRSMARVARQ